MLDTFELWKQVNHVKLVTRYCCYETLTSSCIVQYSGQIHKQGFLGRGAVSSSKKLIFRVHRISLSLKAVLHSQLFSSFHRRILCQFSSIYKGTQFALYPPFRAVCFLGSTFVARISLPWNNPLHYTLH